MIKMKLSEIGVEDFTCEDPHLDPLVPLLLNMAKGKELQLSVGYLN